MWHRESCHRNSDVPGKMGQDGWTGRPTAFPQDGDGSALSLENNFLLCLPLSATVTAARKKGKSKPITRSNYLPSASSRQRLPRLLPKLRFTNTLLQKAQVSEKALPAATSWEASRHQGRPQEFKASFRAALGPAASGQRWGADPLGPQQSVAAPLPQEVRRISSPVGACRESLAVRACLEPSLGLWAERGWETGQSSRRDAGKLSGRCTMAWPMQVPKQVPHLCPRVSWRPAGLLLP